MIIVVVVRKKIYSTHLETVLVLHAACTRQCVFVSAADAKPNSACAKMTDFEPH